MKSIDTFYKAALCCLIIGSLSLQACKKPSEGVEVTVNTKVTSTPMLIRFADAKSDAATLGDFDVAISGKDAAMVVDNYGGKTYKAHNGFLQLALQKSVKPSVQNPLNFTVAAKVTGYAPPVRSIVVTSDSAFEQTVDMG